MGKKTQKDKRRPINDPLALRSNHPRPRYALAIKCSVSQQTSVLKPISSLNQTTKPSSQNQTFKNNGVKHRQHLGVLGTTESVKFHEITKAINTQKSTSFVCSYILVLWSVSSAEKSEREREYLSLQVLFCICLWVISAEFVNLGKSGEHILDGIFGCINEITAALAFARMSDSAYRVETTSRLAQWRIENLASCTYRKSDPFKIGKWKW